MGGAERARPGIRRMLSGIRQAAACMTRRLAYPPAPLQGPSPGLLRPRSGQTARDAFGAGSGTDPDRPFPARHVRHRPGPVTRPSPAFRRTRTKSRPGGWLSTGFLGDLPLWAGPASNRCRQRNPDGLRLPKPRAPRQHARPRTFPPAWLETFAIHPAAGVRRSMAWGWRVWKRSTHSTTHLKVMALCNSCYHIQNLRKSLSSN
jgi:hypothetical protein